MPNGDLRRLTTTCLEHDFQSIVSDRQGPVQAPARPVSGSLPGVWPENPKARKSENLSWSIRLGEFRPNCYSPPARAQATGEFPPFRTFPL